jgi:hypothetical protein
MEDRIVRCSSSPEVLPLHMLWKTTADGPKAIIVTRHLLPNMVVITARVMG